MRQGAIPQQKIVADGVEIQDDTVQSIVFRPENAISRCTLVANNQQGRNYIENIEAFDEIAISYRYADWGDTYTQVFGGVIEECGPESSSQGDKVTAAAYGYGRAIRNTHCAVNYGVESDNSTIDTPSEVIGDLITNRINKNFDADNTGYGILSGKILTMNNPAISYLKGGYRKNIDILNETLTLYQAYQNGSAGAHWFVSPDKYLFVDEIANHTVDTTNWPTWWRTDQTGSTLTDGDFIQSKFTKNVKDYANKVVLFTDLRKPSYDYWTEDSGGQALWDSSGLTSLTDSNAAGKFIVGSHSLLLTTNGAAPGWAFYPSTHDAAWDITKVGSEKSIPTLNFYYYRNDKIYAGITWVILFTTYNAASGSPPLDDYFYCNFIADAADKWYHRSIPIGPYWKTAELTRSFNWTAVGSPDWANINGIMFFTYNASGGNGELYIDDLHITGKIIREAYNSTNITANDEHQKIVHMDVSVNDSMQEADVTGTAAMLAYAELLTTDTTPIVGQVTIPLAYDIKPGQLVHINYNLQPSGSYRVDSNFRVQQAIHNFQTPNPTTTLDLTDDMINTFAKGHEASPTSQLAALHKALFVDPEAKSLKTTGVDELVQRLSHDYA